MKYLVIFILLFTTRLHAQETREVTMTAADTARYEVQRFEGRLARLREGLEKNDISPVVGAYTNLLGDIREEIARTETRAPESPRLPSMQFILTKFDEFIFDPTKPDELKPHLERFDEFLGLMKAERGMK
ncbi:MAG: hypothetical protein R2791_01645 [Saprospiraceae bacterium]|nr:hypothetical protein [Saprospiraceae bacterium]